LCRTWSHDSPSIEKLDVARAPKKTLPTIRAVPLDNNAKKSTKQNNNFFCIEQDPPSDNGNHQRLKL
jgi:hypothetical protein